MKYINTDDYEGSTDRHVYNQYMVDSEVTRKILSNDSENLVVDRIDSYKKRQLKFIEKEEK